MNDEHHISSLVVMHRLDALDELKAFVDVHDALEIAVEGAGRCVLLCETSNQRAVMEHIDALQLLPGVFNVSLIYHHVEPQRAMDDLLLLSQGASA